MEYHSSESSREKIKKLAAGDRISKDTKQETTQSPTSANDWTDKLFSNAIQDKAHSGWYHISPEDRQLHGLLREAN